MAAMKQAAAIIATGLALYAGIASAQTSSSPAAAGEGFPLSLELPPSADTGKAREFRPSPMAPPSSGCAAAFDCRVRVIGAVRHNGAVELNATALKW